MSPKKIQRMMQRMMPKHVFFPIVSLYVFFLSVSAFANLQVFPTRVLLTDQQRSAQISLRHQGKVATKYKIEAVYYKMLPNGTMEKVSEPKKAEQTAVDFIRFSPRQVVLEPNIEQVVRILLRAPADLQEGEYRAHLYFEGFDEEETVDKTRPVEGNTAHMSLKAKMAVAVPVIVRKGNPTVQAELRNLKVAVDETGKLAYTVEMDRKGKSFIYGDLRVLFTPDGATSAKVVGEAIGVSSYIPTRTFTYPLTVETLGKGVLRVELNAPIADGGKSLAVTETALK